MSDLFGDLPETLSPRLAWMRKHGIKLEENALELKTGRIRAFCASGGRFQVCGDTQDEALTSLAYILGIGDWRERRGPRPRRGWKERKFEL
jgi:hypothetical protein